MIKVCDCQGTVRAEAGCGCKWGARVGVVATNDSYRIEVSPMNLYFCEKHNRLFSINPEVFAKGLFSAIFSAGYLDPDPAITDVADFLGIKRSIDLNMAEVAEGVLFVINEHGYSVSSSFMSLLEKIQESESESENSVRVTGEFEQCYVETDGNVCFPCGCTLGLIGVFSWQRSGTASASSMWLRLGEYDLCEEHEGIAEELEKIKTDIKLHGLLAKELFLNYGIRYAAGIDVPESEVDKVISGDTFKKLVAGALIFGYTSDECEEDVDAEIKDVLKKVKES